MENEKREKNRENERQRRKGREKEREGEPNRWRKSGRKELDSKHRKRDTENGKGKQTHR